VRTQDLDAARKAGTAMPDIDAVTGKALNPHIPGGHAQLQESFKHSITDAMLRTQTSWLKRPGTWILEPVLR
jgi:hypothetical protein